MMLDHRWQREVGLGALIGLALGVLILAALKWM